MIIYSALFIIKFKKENILTAINVDPLSAQANYISCTFKVEEVLWDNAPYMLLFVLRRTDSSQKDGISAKIQHCSYKTRGLGP